LNTPKCCRAKHCPGTPKVAGTTASLRCGYAGAPSAAAAPISGLTIGAIRVDRMRNTQWILWKADPPSAGRAFPSMEGGPARLSQLFLDGAPSSGK